MKNVKCKIKKPRLSLMVNGCKTTKTPIAEKSPAIVQTVAIVAPYIFFLMRRCLNGRMVACIRSKEIAARFVTDANGMKRCQNLVTIAYGRLEALIHIQNLHLLPKYENSMIRQLATRKISNCLVDH